MHGFKKITVIGDSYCSERSKNTDWPRYLANLLGVYLFGKGHKGNAWWTARKDLIEKYYKDTENTILIVIHTMSDRLPNDYEIPLNPAVLRVGDLSRNHKLIKDKDPLGDSIIVGQLFYKSKLYSSNFYDWAQQAWIKELDDNADKFFKVIHIPAFHSIQFNLKNSILVRPSSTMDSLFSLAYADNPDCTGAAATTHDDRRNHLNEHNNIKLAEAMAKIIIDTDNDYVGEINFANLDQWDFKTNEIYKQLPAFSGVSK
jgi:hypothetical protein